MKLAPSVAGFGTLGLGRAFLTMTFFLFSAADARAQAASVNSSEPRAAVGSRVRARMGNDNYYGTLVGVRSDTLIMQGSSGYLQRLPMRDVRWIDVQSGTHRQTGVGGLIGLATGIGVGYFRSSDPVEQAAGTFVLGPAGALIGLAVGTLFTTESWTKADARAFPRVSVGCGGLTRCAQLQFAWGDNRR